MVLEYLLSPKTAERHPLETGVLGFLFATIGLFLALWVFEDYASMIMVFLTALAAVPLLYKTISREEAKHVVYVRELTLLKSHKTTLVFLLMLFMGATLAYALWYTVLPASTASSLFRAQTQTIVSLNQQVTGNVVQPGLLSAIFFNNIKVMVFCVIFSFLYGSGAIFILMWNASVIGAALGNFLRVKLTLLTPSLASYLQIIPLSLLRYSIHGVPEVLAYIIGGLAGGIISVACVRHKFGSKDFERVMVDASDLLILAIAMLALAAGLEVYVTPLFF